jgi:DNA-binding NtrC family response regulator
MAYLTDLTRPNHPVEIGDLLLIGTDPQCGLQAQGENVAPRHSRIERKEEGYLLRDLRTLVGTSLNSSCILEAWLQAEDEIQIGESIFVFSHEITTHEGIGLSSKNKDWNQQLERLGHVARTDFPVLLLGSSGTGKEVLAQALHQRSKRSQGPFVSVNCSALTETLVESELFGHHKGSFTGAISDRKGAFEAARGGTLFLDEIGDLPYGLQAKLLRALENGEIRPVGSDKNVKTDVRIIAATHQNLTEKILTQQFRADLYFRLSVISVTPPPLARRMEDFEELLMTFAKKLRVRFSFAAIQRLRQHDWPGNIRELKNTVARASAFFPRTQIELDHIDMILDRLQNHNIGGLSSTTNSISTSGATPLPVLKELEKQMIIKRLVANSGNQRRTAGDLGMPKSTLHDRLKLYSINPQTFSTRPQ